MNKYSGTMYCIKCGKPAIIHAGHLKAREKMALGNLIDVKIGAGWCSEDCYNSLKSDINGCFGVYNNETMGYMPSIFHNPNVEKDNIK